MVLLINTVLYPKNFMMFTIKGFTATLDIAEGKSNKPETEAE